MNNPLLGYLCYVRGILLIDPRRLFKVFANDYASANRIVVAFEEGKGRGDSWGDMVRLVSRVLTRLRVRSTDLRYTACFILFLFTALY